MKILRYRWEKPADLGITGVRKAKADQFYPTNSHAEHKLVHRVGTDMEEQTKDFYFKEGQKSIQASIKAKYPALKLIGLEEL